MPQVSLLRMQRGGIHIEKAIIAISLPKACVIHMFYCVLVERGPEYLLYKLSFA